MPVRPTLRAGHNAGRREPARVAWSIMGAAHGRGKERSEIAGAAASVAERHSCCSVENPSPQPPPRSGEGEQAERRLFFSPSPLRGGGWGGRGFRTGSQQLGAQKQQKPAFFGKAGFWPHIGGTNQPTPSLQAGQCLKR